MLAAQEIAAAPGVRFLAMGGVDLQRDLNTAGGNLQTLYARSHLVAGLPRRRDRAAHRQCVSALRRHDGLREQAEFARSLGFFGKSAIHPRQLDVIHEVFTPTAQEIDMGAGRCSPRSTRADGDAVRAADGEFVDLPSPTGPGACWKSLATSGRRPSIGGDVMAKRPSELTWTPDGRVARVRLRGSAVLASPSINRGTAFTPGGAGSVGARPVCCPPG